jgi:hypothetical protein
MGALAGRRENDATRHRLAVRCGYFLAAAAVLLAFSFPVAAAASARTHGASARTHVAAERTYVSSTRAHASVTRLHLRFKPDCSNCLQGGFVNMAHNLCLNAVQSGDGTNGDNVQLWKCNGGSNQHWNSFAA